MKRLSMPTAITSLLRRRWCAALIFGAIHAICLAPKVDDASVITEKVFHPEAEQILEGDSPYSAVDFEYPPLAVPVVVGPAVVTETPTEYRDGFAWMMLGVDLGIVALLALGVRDVARRWTSLVVYSAGVLILGLLSFGNIEPEPAAMPLARFDLLPAGLLLAAVMARKRARSATWGTLLSLGGTVKAFPFLGFPFLAHGELRLKRVLLAGAVPLIVAVALVVWLGGEFANAIGYHADRGLQIESLAASPFLIGHELGLLDARSGSSAGSITVEAPGAEAARIVSIGLTLLAYAGVLWLFWRRQGDPLVGITAALAVAITLAPVLSPQFILWVLPVSALAFGVGIENAVLLATFLMTRLMLNGYEHADDLGSTFTWSIAARNALLLAFVALCLVRLVRTGPAWHSRADHGEGEGEATARGVPLEAVLQGHTRAHR